MKKISLVFTVMLIAVFAAASAMAYTLNSRSEEMTANSICDHAGTITLTFTEEDYDTITNYLLTNNYVLLRVTLGGQNIDPGADVPILCRDIQGTDTANGALGTPLPNDGDLVELDAINVEVSDVSTVDGTPDVTAHVYGDTGDQYFEIYITGIQPSGTWTEANTFPWIKIGLYDELIAVSDTDTAICADVHDFGGLSLLTVSIDNTPQSLTTTTSDNQIGHFLVEDVTLRDCDKTEDDYCPSTTSIELCPLETVGQGVECPTYRYCFVAEGDFPDDGDISVVIRTNGATNSANDQEGVYFTSISLLNEDDDTVPMSSLDYYEADGITEATVACEWEAENVQFTVNAADISGAGNELRFCISYTVNPDEAAAGTDVRFWVDASTIPCGSLFSGVMTAASLFECGTIPSCMYFPYVLTQTSFATGIVITNLTDVAPADMEAILTLTDSTGAVFTYTKTDFTSKVWSFVLDSVLAEYGWTPAPGNAWLHVQTNFTVDGYSFVTDGSFGAGTLPRVLVNCGDYSSFK